MTEKPSAASADANSRLTWPSGLVIVCAACLSTKDGPHIKVPTLARRRRPRDRQTCWSKRMGLPSGSMTMKLAGPVLLSSASLSKVTPCARRRR